MATGTGTKRRRMRAEEDGRELELDPFPREVRSAEGEHRSSGIVCSIAASADGRVVFSGSSDTSLRAWDVSTPEVRCLQTIENAHDDWVRCLAIDRTGNLLFTGSRDESIRVWRVRLPPNPLLARPPGNSSEKKMDPGPVLRLAGILRGHKDWVRHVATFESVESVLFSVSDDCTIKEWDLSPFSSPSKRGLIEVETCLRTRSSHLEMKSFVVCPDGVCMYVSFSDFTVRGMEIHSGDLQRTLRGHGGIVTCMVIPRATA